MESNRVKIFYVFSLKYFLQVQRRRPGISFFWFWKISNVMWSKWKIFASSRHVWRSWSAWPSSDYRWKLNHLPQKWKRIDCIESIQSLTLIVREGLIVPAVFQTGIPKWGVWAHSPSPSTIVKLGLIFVLQLVT